MFKTYFNFSKKEFNGILVLCILIAIVLLLPLFYQYFQKQGEYNFLTFEKDIKAFKASAMLEPKYDSYNSLKNEIEDTELKTKYFEFDPNGLSQEAWLKLGLSLKQIKGIKNYEAKGGKFYKKEDVKKMYSITSAKYAALEPYIKISISSSSKYETYKLSGKIKQSKGSKNWPIVPVVELNEADSAKLETIRGIGPAFASRIIKYRKRLGGFYTKEQLREVYGLDSSKYEQLKALVSINDALIQKINLNTAVFDDLKRHPYLTYKQMNAILQYRKQHGEYKSIEDLKKIAILNADIIHRIEPYLAF